MAQGKEWNKEKVIEVLEPYLKMGMSVTKACKSAAIPQSTVATWISDDEILRLKIEAWQREPNDLARRVVLETLKDPEHKDRLVVALDWLEKKEKDEFSKRSELTGGDGESLRVEVNYDTKPNTPDVSEGSTGE